MVNYRYNLKYLERNHEAYANHREIVAAGAVTRYLKAPSNLDQRVKA
jgi:malonyl-CoA decarboxylase